MKFLDREMELEFLNRKHASNQPELIILYGRRRIGKTEILNHFTADKKALYFLGRLESREDTLKRFSHTLTTFFNDARPLSSPLTTWDAIFDYLAAKTSKRETIIMDEFPFLMEKFPEITSVLQDKCDSTFKKTKIMLILCGSSVSSMEKYALDQQSPLYGRRTGQWRVTSLPIHCLQQIFPQYSTEDKIQSYSFLDMIPGYLSKFSPEQSVWANVKEKMLTKGEFLYDEVEFLLREELRDPSNYMSILSAIAGGTTTFSEIHSRTQLDKSLLSKYLYVLERLDITQKITPVTDTHKSKLKSKNALYALKDNFFDFWFRFTYPNKQALEEGRADQVLQEVKNTSDYPAKKFEQFTTRLLPYLNAFQATSYGKWWNKQNEIDAVALNDKTKQILFCECKWQENVDAKKILAKLQEKTSEVEWHKQDRTEYYALFAKSFNKKLREEKTHCYDLKDIEKTLKTALQPQPARSQATRTTKPKFSPNRALSKA
ncbi:ATP-binding protein [Candidatus Micrarchaeota archaeon]|nr:ATP-binding protein [Candidatus Micrarchaeota archaeon]